MLAGKEVRDLDDDESPVEVLEPPQQKARQ
jgi:hypothetical protein